MIADNVLFIGAGASFGSDTVGRPPLGSALFDSLCDFHPPTWGSLSVTLADEFRADFEKGMTLVPAHSVAPLQRVMAAYFFQFAPSPASLYLRLARRIRATPAWSGAICTINYERLVELSLGAEGLQPYVGQPPTSPRPIELCLPHGCCHIFCDSVQGAAGLVSFNAHAVQTSGTISVITDPAEHARRIQQDAFPPVMSYFEPSKHTTAGKSFIDGQRARWIELAGNAKNIVVIGVKVRASDAHIWNPISLSGARVIYCSGRLAATEYDIWRSTARAGANDLVLTHYFSDSFDTICSELGL